MADTKEHRLLPAHREHLAASGLTDAAIDAAGIYSVTDAATAGQLLGWNGPGPAPAIAIPNFGIDGEVNVTLLRPDVPHVRHDGSAPKYESPVGHPPRLYFPNVLTPAAWADSSERLIITEGIKKALAAVQAGRIAISAQGTNVWHDVAHKDATGEWKLHPDFDRVPLRNREVFVAFDGGDTTVNPHVILAEATVARMFLDAGALPRLMRVPFSDPSRKVGLDDFLADQADPRGALDGLMVNAIDADPLTRAQGVGDERGALAHIRDLSFAAALHVGGQAIQDVVTRAMKMHGITRGAIEEAVAGFRAKLKTRSVPAVAAVDPAIAAEADRLLRDPQLVSRFLRSMERQGVVGEHEPSVTVLLAAVTRNAPEIADHLHLAVKASSASGKNYVVGTVLKHVPPQDVQTISDMSPKALQYMTEPLSGKVVLLVEQNAADRAEYPLRISMSEGKIVTHSVQKDEETGQLRAVQHEVEAKATFISTTTRSLLHPENETRVLEVTLDESQEQNQRIVEARLRAAEHPPSTADREQRDREIEIWRAALAKIEPCQVLLPGAAKFAKEFRTGRTRVRRDVNTFLALVKAHARLHQYQRQQTDAGEVIATEADFAAAKRLGMALWTPASRRLLQNHVRLKQAFGIGQKFTAQEATTALGQSSTDVTNRHLRDLEDAELVSCVETRAGRRPAQWIALDTVAADEPQRGQPREAKPPRQSGDGTQAVPTARNTQPPTAGTSSESLAPASAPPERTGPPASGVAEERAASTDGQSPCSIGEKVRGALTQHPSKTVAALANIVGVTVAEAQHALERGVMTGWAERTDLGGCVIYNPLDPPDSDRRATP